MKVSIIIPIYNVGKFVEHCLLSVLNQTYPDIEILLIDDCGSDNSMEIARKVVALHSNKQHVRFLTHTQNRGLSTARNTGIEASRGDYIYFLDSDDFIKENCIEEMLSLAQEVNADVVIANYSEISDDNEIIHLRTHDFNNDFLFTNNDFLKAFCMKKVHVMAWNKLIKRKFITTVPLKSKIVL